MQVKELQATCTQHGLPKSGNQVDLMLRLAIHGVPRGVGAMLDKTNMPMLR